MPSHEAARILIFDPNRVRACAEWGLALADLVGEGIAFYGRQAAFYLQEQAKVDTECQKSARNPEKNLAQIRKAGLERKAIQKNLGHAKKEQADLQSAQEQLKRESAFLRARATVLEHPEKLAEIEATCGVEARAWLEHQIGIDVLREAIQNMDGPEGEAPDQFVADHDEGATDTAASFPLVTRPISPQQISPS
jgi:hypothetical protein